MNTEAFMVLPWPPSVNSYWRHSARGTYIGKPGRQFRKDALAAIKKEQLKPFGESRVSVVIELRAPDRRKRDIDNHTKGLLDALTHSGIIDDDSQVDQLKVIRGPIEKEGAAYVTIEAIQGQTEIKCCDSCFATGYDPKETFKDCPDCNGKGHK